MRNVIQLTSQSPKCFLQDNCHNLKSNRNPLCVHSTSSLKIWKKCVFSRFYYSFLKISGTHSVTELTIVSFRYFTYHCFCNIIANVNVGKRQVTSYNYYENSFYLWNKWDSWTLSSVDHNLRTAKLSCYCKFRNVFQSLVPQSPNL